MTVSKKHCTIATRFIRNLRGGSHPFLAEASDGNVYVIKFADNLQGPRVPFNESMGTELYRACGLSVADWIPLLITESFLDRNPACWFETPRGLHRPHSGICFGSRFLGAAGTALFEVLPGTYFQRVRNACDFWVAWLLDICAFHADNRQALFCEHSTRLLDAVFIDFGHMFGGPTGRQASPQFVATSYRDLRIYPQTSDRFLNTIRRVVANLDCDQLIRHLHSIPDEWKSAGAVQSFMRCLDRLADTAFLSANLDTIVCSSRTTVATNNCSCQGWKPAVSVLRSRLQSETREGKFMAS